MTEDFAGMVSASYMLNIFNKLCFYHVDWLPYIFSLLCCDGDCHTLSTDVSFVSSAISSVLTLVVSLSVLLYQSWNCAVLYDVFICLLGIMMLH